MSEKENTRPEENHEQPHPRTVCGREMTADTAWYPCTDYQGRTIYFCTEFCLEAFHADPDRFYIAHSRNKDQYTEN
jgi:YHS domain-containing protein